MEIWIIRDGEKAGPYHDFEIRRKIGTYELDAETPAWHEGMERWKTLGNIELFRKEFEIKTATETAPMTDGPAPPPLPLKQVFIRRFFARWFDLQVYGAVWWVTLWASGRNIGDVIESPLVLLLQYIPWFAIEAILLHKLGTTPGKWLLGMKVANIDQSLLSVRESTRRCLRVMFAGIGLGWWIMPLFCQTISLVMAKSLGNTLWDFSGGHRVFPAALKVWRVILFCVGFYCALLVQTMVLFPWYPEEKIDVMDKIIPGLKQEIKQSPQWYFPKEGPKWFGK